MNQSEELLRTVRRNKLVGMWAAEKLGLLGENAKAYSDDLAMGSLDLKRSDVLGKIRKDFATAGVVQSDEQNSACHDPVLARSREPRTNNAGRC